MAGTLLQRRKALLGSAYRHFYDEPLHLVRGSGVHLFDADGNRYLDMYNNVPHVGHCHPRVVSAVSEQLAQLNTHTRYLNAAVVDYAERLTATMPASLDTAMFACTGSEANELALRIAGAVTGAEGIVVVDFAYHGNSRATAEISPETPMRGGVPGHVRAVPAPNTFSGPHRDAAASATYADYVEAAIQDLLANDIGLSAVVVDTILSSTGVIEPPPGYLASIANLAHKYGGLFIADEVQPGFGRTGHTFWGFERDAVIPDVVTMGKPMANGYPMSAVVARAEYVDAFAATSGYFNTFGGSPVAAVAANTVLDVMDDEKLQHNAVVEGDYLFAGLRALADRYPLIGDVRGNGLFLGVELVTDHDSREPHGAAGRWLVNALKSRRVLAGVVGPHDHIVKLRPPMVLQRNDSEFFLECLESALSDANRSGMH